MNEEVAVLAARPGVAAWRIRLAERVESPLVTRAIVGVILVNAALMGLETHAPLMAVYGDLVHVLDKICLGVFVVELSIKLLAYGLTFWRSGWRNFDFFVVAVALVPGAGPWAVLRSLRVLRVLRLLTVIPTLRRVVTAFLHAIPGLMGVIAVMLIVFYTGGVLATTLYADVQPEYFGDLPSSLYTLFQIMTLDSWFSTVVRPMIDQDPTAGPFFLIFVVVTSFTVLNLFIGIIVTAMQEMTAAEERATAEKAANKAAKQAIKDAKAADGEAHDGAAHDDGDDLPRATDAAHGTNGTGASSAARAPSSSDGESLAVDAKPSSAEVDAIIARMERDLDALRKIAARN